jgi:hypothetical protein
VWIEATSGVPGPIFVQALTAYKGSISCTDAIQVTNNGERRPKFPSLPRARFVQVIRNSTGENFECIGARFYCDSDRQSAIPKLEVFLESPGQ